MNIILMLLLLLGGCAYQPLTHQPQNQIADIKPLPQVDSVLRQVPDKPAVTIIGDGVQLDRRGMVDLVNLYKGAKDITNERNQLVVGLNRVIDERNQLLRVAKLEEGRANDLSKQLDAEIDGRTQDRFWKDLELNITRAALVLIAVGL